MNIEIFKLQEVVLNRRKYLSINLAGKKPREEEERKYKKGNGLKMRE